jgi:UDP:flavonoid glycosyltransferase YjiC (YdhE family)
MDVDVLFVTDPRFQGGTSTSVAAEIRACRKASLTCALLMIKGPALHRTRGLHPEVAATVRDGACSLVDPAQAVSARLVLVHHPSLFLHLPAHRLTIDAGRVVLVLQHPEIDAAGIVQYDLATVVETMRLVFRQDVLLAPVGPLARASLRQPIPAGSELLPWDWYSLIDLDDWPRRPPGPAKVPIQIGRHSRPQVEKWPDLRQTAEAVYPVGPDFRVRMLGADQAALTERYGALPANWELIPFGEESVTTFLGDLDFYVYYHSDGWREAFGRSPLEAMATGLVTILPPQFEPLFGEAAVYAEPRDVLGLIRRFAGDPGAFALQGEKARRLVGERFGPSRITGRVAAVAPAAPARPSAPALRDRAPIRMLMVTSNGVGIGHLTRLLAVAKRLPPGIQPVFFTLSQAVKLVRDAGYLAEFVPFHRGLGADPEPWNDHLAEALYEAIAFYRPRVLVFDGNVPYTGLLRAVEAFPTLFTVWVRRAMWSPSNAVWLEREELFDAVIEPGEIAAAYDSGPTRARTGAVLQVPPILLCDADDRLSREEARAALGIDAEMVSVGLQLGSGSNYDLGKIRAAVVEALLDRPDVHVTELVSPVGGAPVPTGGRRHAVLQLYPSYRHSRAFDFVVSGAGYNSFHECIAGAIPAIFVPNEAAEMDRQITRAEFAERAGTGRLLRARDVYSAAGTVADLMDPVERARMEAACRRLAQPNGAEAVARFLADLALFVRTDRDTMDGMVRPRS